MKLKNKRILVTGITGTLGERVAKNLLHKGAMVSGLIRDERFANKFQRNGIRTLIGNLEKRNSLFDATKNIDIIVHCAAYLGEDLDQAMEANVAGVENIANAAINNGVKKLIHISTVSVYGEPTQGFFDESSPIIENHSEPYIATKAKSERILNDYMKKGLQVIILRPGAICAEENSYWGDRQISRMKETTLIDWVHPDDSIPWVHAENLVEMINLVIEKGTSGQVYNAIDGNYSEKDFRMKLISA